MAFKELSAAQQEQLIKLRQLEATLQNIRIQQAEFNRTLQENNLTKKELAKLDPDAQIWKSVGSVMFPKKVSDTLKELTDRIELIELNLKRLSKQETEIKEKLEELQARLSSQLSSTPSN